MANNRVQVARRYSNKRFHRRRAAGQCTGCGREKELSRIDLLRCGKCSADATIQARKWHKKNPEHSRRTQREIKERLRDSVLLLYGNCCACCGETYQKFLTMDHVNNDGNKHKQASGLRYGGSALHYYLKIHNYPSGFQILCWNCNMGKAHNGGICPHITEVAKALLVA